MHIYRLWVGFEMTLDCDGFIQYLPTPRSLPLSICTYIVFGLAFRWHLIVMVLYSIYLPLDLSHCLYVRISSLGWLWDGTWLWWISVCFYLRLHSPRMSLLNCLQTSQWHGNLKVTFLFYLHVAVTTHLFAEHITYSIFFTKFDLTMWFYFQFAEKAW